MNGFQRRREQKKKDILEAALALFMEYGVQKPSIAEIAKKANVSQVTIYNYFESKQNLIHETFIYYMETTSEEFEQIVSSHLEFPEKIKQIIFNKKKVAKQIHEELYQYFMKEYTAGNSYIEKMYVEKALPRFIQLFDEGKKQGYVDPGISNEAILIYIQAINEYIQRDNIYPNILPLTEEITKLFFYGIMGMRGEKD